MCDAVVQTQRLFFSTYSYERGLAAIRALTQLQQAAPIYISCRNKPSPSSCPRQLREPDVGVRGGKVSEELGGGRGPRAVDCILPATASVELQRALNGAHELIVHAAGDAGLDDVNRAGDRIGRDRHAAGHGLQLHQTEGIGAAREDEYGGGGGGRGRGGAGREAGE